MVPFLTLAAGLSQHAAEATSLLVILPTAIAGSARRCAAAASAISGSPSASAWSARPAAVGGALLALALPAGALRIVFAVFVGARRAEIDARRPALVAAARHDAGARGPAGAGRQARCGAAGAVLNGELVSGTRLRQEALAEEFGVSRTPIREALRKLQASGLVELHPHRGALVRGSLGTRDPRRIRGAGGARGARRRARRRERSTRSSSTSCTRCRRSSARRCRARSSCERGDADFDPAEETERWGLRKRPVPSGRAGGRRERRPRVDADAPAPQLSARSLAQVLGESTTLLEDNVREHEAILEAIERRDAAAARGLMVEHVRHAGALVTLRLEQRG